MPFPASGGATVTGHVKCAIRLAYHGCTNRPFFHLVVIEAWKPRQGLCIEQLGTYDPLPNVHNEKLCALNLERLTYWLGRNVHVSRGACKLLGLAGLLPIHPHTYSEGWNARKKARERREAQLKEEEEKKKAV